MCYAMAAGGVLLASVMYLPKKLKDLYGMLKSKCCKKKSKKKVLKKKKK
tara:strand:+ start:334 stop:480 length:147 start_codon:yes stop_codon:yes gene_type:complete